MDVDTEKPQVRIAPLDRLQVPPALDGQSGKFRRRSASNEFGVNTDIEAVRLWLHRYDANASTYRSFQQAVERLINWALVQRGKPLSSLDDNDFVAFEEFLADPKPRSRWISSRGTPRSDPSWTPLVGPLSPSSRLLTFKVLRVMFDWLRNRGYCDVGRSLWRHAIGSSVQPSGLILNVAHDATPEFIGLDDWRVLKRSLEDDPASPQHLESRLAVEFMYYGGLSLKEVSDICIDDITRLNDIMLLCVRSRAPHLSTIYLLPPVVKTIDCALGAVALRSDGRPVEVHAGQDNGEEVSRTRLFSARDVGALVNWAFRHAAKMAASDGDLAAATRLKALTSRSLRHAFEVHAKRFDDGNWLWLLIGAARLLSPYTRQYLQRRALTGSELECAIRSLAPCWQKDEGDG